jgi:hypothetical protein
MPAVLTKPKKIETWMTAPREEPLKLQRASPDGVLKIVSRRMKKDEVTARAKGKDRRAVWAAL